jgi:hypothetical protein
MADYSAEACVRAVTFMLELIEACFKAPDVSLVTLRNSLAEERAGEASREN